MKKLLLATSNQGKIKELEDLLSPVHCIAQSEYGLTSPEETGLSFIENALLKARHASIHTGMPALADDSGLVVPALDGAPGIYSARYAGLDANDAKNIALLLENIKDIKERDAFFYCAIAIVHHPKDPTPIIATGAIHGVITYEPAGVEGFGYDPVFFIPEYQCTAAELPASIKNTISHRANALKQLRQLTSLYE